MKNWLDDAADEIARNTAEASDNLNTIENRAKLAEKSKNEFQRGVRLGWHDENGEPLDGAEEE
jgi:hypothetical protein